MASTNTALAAKLDAKNGNGSAVAQPKTVADSIRSALEKMKGEIAVALPKHLTAERLSRIALTTIRTNPKLLECSVESLLAGVMHSAQLGVEPGLLGHAYFVPFFNKKTGKSEVQFIIGYKGLIELARRSGQIQTISAGAIYSNDRFKYKKGFEEVLEHEPNFKDRGVLAGFYAYATTKDGGRYADVMTLEEVNRIRERSKAKDYGPWVTDFEEMGKKTVVRRLSKYLPLSIEFASQIAEDESKEFGEVSSIELNLGENSKSEALPEPKEAIEIASVPVAEPVLFEFDEGCSDQ